MRALLLVMLIGCGPARPEAGEPAAAAADAGPSDAGAVGAADAGPVAEQSRVRVRPLANLRGRVTDGSGAGLDGVTVVVTGPGLSEPASGTSDREGRFLVLGLPPGEYTVHFFRGSAMTRRDDVPVPGKPVEVELAGP